MDHEQAPEAPAAQPQTVEDTTPHPEHIQILTPDSGESNVIAGRDTSRASSTYPLNAASEGRPTLPRSPENPYADFEHVRVASPARSRDGRARVSFQRQTLVSNLPVANQNDSGIDWIVPVEAKGDVSVMFNFWIRLRHTTSTCATLGASHCRRTPSTNDRQCCH
jgi:hypothetical protein